MTAVWMLTHLSVTACLLRAPRWTANFSRIIMSEARCPKRITDFSEFQFSPSKLITLPIEENQENYVRRNVRNVVFSFVKPTPLMCPRLVAASKGALALLDMEQEAASSQEFAEWLAGNKVLESSVPLAHRYGGHQFGYWAMQLGDGRAVLLGEYVNSLGERWEAQVKGSGKTPYSREGDGRAVLRSSVREHLCSEAMHHLGIPTSRSGALVVCENRVMRDPLYDGHPILEKTAVVLRLAPSWFRIGSLEILAKSNEHNTLRTLVDFVIKEHFPDVAEGDGKYMEFLSRVFRLCSDLVVEWQGVGFTHGVMNTDNISLVGVTIDYGPFGFMEDFDPVYVPNHSDSEARYCYGNQTKIMMYNLLKLTQAMAPLLGQEHLSEAVKLLEFEQKYLFSKLTLKFSQKLGFTSPQEKLVEELMDLLVEASCDMTMVFRELSENPLTCARNPPKDLWALHDFAKHAGFPSFIESYVDVLAKEGISDTERMDRMKRVNPRYTLRNWMAQEAIKLAEEGDFSEVQLLQRVLESPFTRQDEAEERGYAKRPPEWSKTFQLSCSS